MEFVPIIAGVGLTAALVALAVIDLRTYRLPNVITLPLAGAGLLYAGFWQGAWVDSLIGMAVGYGAFVAVELLYKRVRGRAGLGRGDAKLLAAGGAWLGWAALPYVVLVGSGSAIVMLLLLRERMTDAAGRLAFGPFLALGIGAVWWGRLLA